jgi:hypothetical protein
VSRYDTEEDLAQDEQWEEEEAVEAAPTLPPPRTRRPPAPRFTASAPVEEADEIEEAEEAEEEPGRTPVAVAASAPARRAVRPQATPPQRRDPTRSKRRQPATDEAITVRPAASAAPARRSLSRGAMLRLGVIGVLALVVIGGAALAGLGAFTPPPTFAPTPTAGVGVTGKANYEPPADKVVARVNDVPIMYDDWQRRIGIDKTNMLADPFSAMMLNNFEGITGTRALDVLYYDSLDKLINFEIIQQQAVKENMVPTADEQKQMLDQAHEHDTTPDKPFAQFLEDHKMTQEQYDHNVIASVIYAAMANKHMPATTQAANDDERVSKFIEWTCGLRKDYKVEIFVTFAVYNQACTSGLPSDVPIVGEPTPQPEAVPTGPAPTLPPGATPVNTPSSPDQAPPAVPTGSAAPVGPPNQ